MFLSFFFDVFFRCLRTVNANLVFGATKFEMSVRSLVFQKDDITFTDISVPELLSFLFLVFFFLNPVK